MYLDNKKWIFSKRRFKYTSSGVKNYFPSKYTLRGPNNNINVVVTSFLRYVGLISRTDYGQSENNIKKFGVILLSEYIFTQLFGNTEFF